MSAESTEEKDVMSGPEAEEFIEELKKVFSIVRLLDKDNFEHMERHYNEHVEVPCQCYEIWKKKSPCENCISTKTFADGKQRTKLEFIDSKIYQVISRYIEIDGKPYVMELVSQLDENSLVDADGRNRLLKKLAGYNKELYTDVLTGTYNRRYYEEQLKMMREAAGVAMIDLDDFKMYNDTYGHKAGDRVLDTTVQIIRSCIRKSDILVRYGGDEFLLILPDIEEKNFVERLKKIQEEIHKSQIPGYTKLQLSVSIGGVLTDRETVESAVNRADRFMYQAKIQKNMVVTEDGAFQGSNGSFAILNRKRKNHRVLIVDDSEMNRFLLREMIGPEFEILEAENGAECLDMLRRYGTGISLVLLDIVMPVMDGFEVLEKMNKNHWIDDIPVIMISSEDSAAFIRRAYDMGVSDYISRPFDAQVVYRRVMNTIKLYARQRRLINLVTDQVYEKEKNNRMMIGILSEIVEFRNGESGPHVLHINMLTELLLEELVRKTDLYNLTWNDRLLITTASSLHDIGKIGIPESILNKPGKLTKEEFEEMKKHTLIGASMLKNLGMYQNEPLMETAYQICRWHHERYDGKGYPDGLAGEQIPISAQVVSLADVYDALVSERVYKKAYSHDTALQMILNGECGTFNPILLECLKSIHEIVRHEYEKEASKSKDAEKTEDVVARQQQYEKTKEYFFKSISKDIKNPQEDSSGLTEDTGKNFGGGITGYAGWSDKKESQYSICIGKMLKYQQDNKRK